LRISNLILFCGINYAFWGKIRNNKFRKDLFRIN